MKYKLLAYAVLSVLGLGLLGVNVVSAHGFGFFGGFGPALSADEIVSHHQAMFESQANLLGVSVDVVKNGWAQGKTLSQIAEENGITAEQLQQKMKDARLQQFKSQLQTLVDKGVITQAQADQRLQFMQNAQNSKSSGHMGRGLGGWFH